MFVFTFSEYYPKNLVLRAACLKAHTSVLLTSNLKVQDCHFLVWILRINKTRAGYSDPGDYTKSYIIMDEVYTERKKIAFMMKSVSMPVNCKLQTTD